MEVECREDGGEAEQLRGGGGIYRTWGREQVKAGPVWLRHPRAGSVLTQTVKDHVGKARVEVSSANGHAPIGGLALLLTCDCTTILRLKMAVDVILLVSKPVHRDPVTEGLHLFPHLGVSLLDPSLDPTLLFNIGSGVVPIAETVSC